MAFSLDFDLIDKVLAGDRTALSALLTDLSPHVARQLLRYPVSDDDRRDLLQTTLMQIMRRIGSFRGDSSFSTWLFRVTANEALMLMRSQRRLRARIVQGLEFEDLAGLPSVAQNDAADLAENRVATRERDARVRRALAELPDDYRDVVVAHYHLDLGLHEIAERFELSESAVRSRLHRARTRLRGLLDATPVGAESRMAAARSLSSSVGALDQAAE